MQIVRVESRAAAVRCGPFFCPGRPGTGKTRTIVRILGTGAAAQFVFSS